MSIVSESPAVAPVQLIMKVALGSCRPNFNFKIVGLSTPKIQEEGKIFGVSDGGRVIPFNSERETVWF